jgi:hypothetical protein
MADCCNASVHPHKHCCPANGLEYAEVPARTIRHHLRAGWCWDDRGRRFFFCDDPACDVVYFSDDGAVILKTQLRTAVGVKETAANALLCYCFGVTRAAALNQPEARQFVLAQTRLGQCSCKTNNPSGRCCLKDFPPSNE